MATKMLKCLAAVTKDSWLLWLFVPKISGDNAEARQQWILGISANLLLHSWIQDIRLGSTINSVHLFQTISERNVVPYASTTAASCNNLSTMWLQCNALYKTCRKAVLPLELNVHASTASNTIVHSKSALKGQNCVLSCTNQYFSYQLITCHLYCNTFWIHLCLS